MIGSRKIERREKHGQVEPSKARRSKSQKPGDDSNYDLANFFEGNFGGQ